MWHDARAYGRPIWRFGAPAGHHDGWKPCTATATEVVTVDGQARDLCAAHARQARAVVAAGLAGRLCWRP
jgi:hypothetical protein